MKTKKATSQIRWFKLFLLILVVLGLVFAYGKTSYLLRKSIESGLELAFDAPVEVSLVYWTPLNVKISRIAVVDKNAVEYSFVAKEINAEISFNHFIRRSFVLNDLSFSLAFDEKIPEDKLDEYQKILADRREEKEAKEEIREAKAEEAKEDLKAQIIKIWGEYIGKKEAEILVFKEEIKQINEDIKAIKANSEKPIAQIDTLQKELKDLGKRIDDAYNAKDAKKILVLIQEIDQKRKEIVSLKNDINEIVKRANSTKQSVVKTKEGMEEYVLNIKNNYKTIIMNDMGFFMDQVPSLSKVFAAKELIGKYERFYDLYDKFNTFRKKYFKAKDEKEEKEKEDNSTDFAFLLESAAPDFWIRKGGVEIITESINFTGELSNITSSNQEINDLSEVLLKGKDADYEININTYWDDEKFYGEINAKNFAVSDIDLNVITLKSGLVNYKLEYSFAIEKGISLEADLHDVTFSGGGAIYNTVNSIDSFYLKTYAKNENDKWNIKANSDLDTKIGESIKKEFENKKKEAATYAEGLFNDWYEKNIPESYALLGKTAEPLKNIIDVSKRQEVLDNISTDIENKASAYMETLKKEALDEGLKDLFK